MMNYRGLFQDYNARIHGIPTVKTHGFSHMDWSPKRPDFNPTGCSGEYFRQKSNSPIINTRFWMEIDIVTLHGFIKMMPERIRAVISISVGSLCIYF